MSRLVPLWQSLVSIGERLARARRLLVATDYDGTLTPIVQRPEWVSLDVRVHAALAALVKLPRANVAVLSGRKLDDLVPLLGLEHVFLAGCAGFETLNEAGRRQVHVPPERMVPPELVETLQAWVAEFEGARLEDKRLTFTVHYREVSPRGRDRLRAGVRARVRRFRSAARLVPGKMAYEVQPRMAWDKASAFDLWAGRHREALCFYFGDDEVDEPVFEAVRRARGISVAVGRTRTHARYAVEESLEVLWFLEWLTREWAARIEG